MQNTDVAQILTIDVGTSALKVVLYTADGKVLETAASRYEYQIPQPGWAEINPEICWSALFDAFSELRQRDLDLHMVQVIGFTGQMHTPVLLDVAGEIIPPTILWLDRRAVSETKELQQILKLPPHHLNSTYTLPKLLWLSRHQPEVLQRTQHLLWPKDYIRYRFTGHVFSEVNEAGAAALLNWDDGTWASERLEIVGLPSSVLPPLRPPNSDAGPILPEVATKLGLSTSVKIIVGAGDVVALLGGAPPKAGRITCSLGSSAMLASPLSARQTVDDARHRLYTYPLHPYRLLNGVLSTSGASLVWAKEALYGESSTMEDLVDSIQETQPGAEGLIFLPYLAGERSPYWNDALRGSFWGLTLAHHRGHMVRAVLEGVAYSLRHAIDIAGELGVPINEIALAGGGSAVVGWPQIIADVCDRPVLIFAGQDTVSRPLYAYCCVAMDENVLFEDALQRTFDQPIDIFQPDKETSETYNYLYQKFRILSDFSNSSSSMDA